jgi:hypothetical protein
VLRDVDVSLASWLTGYLPEGGSIGFDIASPPDPPALGLYLHDVREEAELTPGSWSDVRGDDGVLVGRLPPQRRYRMTYLVTAWARDTLAEHEILGNVLAGCALHHVVPAASLVGCLAEDGQAVMVRCAPHDRACDPRELWAAWRIPPRTALELSVLAALPVSALVEMVAPPRRVGLNSTSR